MLNYNIIYINIQIFILIFQCCIIIHSTQFKFYSITYNLKYLKEIKRLLLENSFREYNNFIRVFLYKKKLSIDCQLKEHYKILYLQKYGLFRSIEDYSGQKLNLCYVFQSNIIFNW